MKKGGPRASKGQAKEKTSCSFTVRQDERTKVKVIGSMRSTPRASAARIFSVRNIRLPYVDGIFEKSENLADVRERERGGEGGGRGGP